MTNLNINHTIPFHGVRMPACPKCNAQLAEGDVFCPHCGTPVKAVGTAPVQAEAKIKCPRCGGEMHEGKASIRGQSSSSFGMRGFGMGFPGRGFPSERVTTEVQWQEKTGRKTGSFVKSDEEKTMSLVGQRCIKCGYVEFYVRE